MTYAFGQQAAAPGSGLKSQTPPAALSPQQSAYLASPPSIASVPYKSLSSVFASIRLAVDHATVAQFNPSSQQYFLKSLTALFKNDSFSNFEILRVDSYRDVPARGPSPSQSGSGQTVPSFGGQATPPSATAQQSASALAPIVGRARGGGLPAVSIPAAAQQSSNNQASTAATTAATPASGTSIAASAQQPSAGVSAPGVPSPASGPSTFLSAPALAPQSSRKLLQSSSDPESDIWGINIYAAASIPASVDSIVSFTYGYGDDNVTASLIGPQQPIHSVYVDCPPIFGEGLDIQ